MKIIYLGTPEFSAKVLEKLLSSRHEVVAVVCQPDKPVGRKQILEFPPVKKLAIENHIPVYQFQKIRVDGVDVLSKIDADIMVTCAYGQILSQQVLDITRYGVINVHASLLPKHRGAAPIQWSILMGDKVTGVTIMKTDIGLDTGDQILQEQFDILDSDDIVSVYDKMLSIAPKMLIETLDNIQSGKVKYIQQNNELATYEPMLKKEMAQIDFSKSNVEIFNQIRALKLWPVAFTTCNSEIIKIYSSHIVEFNTNAVSVGEVVRVDKFGIIVKCGQGLLSLDELQFAGGKVLSASDIANGKKIKVGEILGK